MTDDKNSDHTPSCGWRDTLQHGGLSSLIEEQQLKETERETFSVWTTLLPFTSNCLWQELTSRLPCQEEALPCS